MTDPHESRQRDDMTRRSVLLQQVQQIAEGAAQASPAGSADALTRICALLLDELPVIDWAGFYLVASERPGRLRLGPYAGEPQEPTEVALGEGICGRAAAQRDAFVAPDLREVAGGEMGHPEMRSEMAVPVLDGDVLAGSLDVASRLPAAFDDDDRVFLRRVGELAGPLAERRRREA